MVKTDNTTKALNLAIKTKDEPVQQASCLVCNSNNQVLVFKNIKDLEYETYKPVDYFVCKNCGLISQNPLPPQDKISSFYPASYRNYLPIKNNLFSFLKRLQFYNLAKKISRYFPKDPKILEIGFGNGELLLALKQRGYENLYGIDFVDKNFLDLKSEGIKLAAGNVENEIPFSEKFDVIIMNNVIEHFLNPKKVLENNKKNLALDGKIILITPNSNALEFLLFKKYWAGFHAPRHTFIFSERNIRLLAEKLGFSRIITRSIIDPGQWSISIQNIFQDINITKANLKNGMAWYLVLVSIFCFPLTFLQNIVKKSTSIMCVLEL